MHFQIETSHSIDMSSIQIDAKAYRSSTEFSYQDFLPVRGYFCLWSTIIYFLSFVNIFFVTFSGELTSLLTKQNSIWECNGILTEESKLWSIRWCMLFNEKSGMWKLFMSALSKKIFGPELFRFLKPFILCVRLPLSHGRMKQIERGAQGSIGIEGCVTAHQ